MIAFCSWHIGVHIELDLLNVSYITVPYLLAYSFIAVLVQWYTHSHTRTTTQEQAHEQTRTHTHTGQAGTAHGVTHSQCALALPHYHGNGLRPVTIL